ncbi:MULTISPECIES: VanZ family protein [Oceanobacillus]|uniref:VanZ family protein n=1 Tax=Oceanobacillus kimchii TaxID=746691 RepID=A0ABQ5TN37_9BACI|nr:MULTISPECIES: VanZ family protein [Oceanobacillus]MBT2600143.1 VanZ family protein [Oceanobacillus sp. ISL-74]MBT2650301.1 VanZ family protein [Oceanobacillus sp. ISL-73]OEH55145.1 hypothetical protein AQ616_08860 [Oceanobacillus sp. E9]GLO67184.1 VanZ family protein [Oceanobacillus kimchii]
MRLKLLYWLLPIMWMVVIFISSATPYENQDVKPLLSGLDLRFLSPYLSWIEFTYHSSIVSVKTLGIEGFIEFFIRKSAHVGVFFVLTCLFFISFIKNTQWKRSKIYIWSITLTALYAVADELHQGITPNRTPYVGDVILDILGGSLALIVIAMIFQITKKV